MGSEEDGFLHHLTRRCGTRLGEGHKSGKWIVQNLKRGGFVIVELLYPAKWIAGAAASAGAVTVATAAVIVVGVAVTAYLVYEIYDALKARDTIMAQVEAYNAAIAQASAAGNRLAKQLLEKITFSCCGVPHADKYCDERFTCGIENRFTAMASLYASGQSQRVNPMYFDIERHIRDYQLPRYLKCLKESCDKKWRS